MTGGKFFCQACVVDRPIDDQSSDPRYCQSCYDYLINHEVILLTGRKVPSWVPRGAIINSSSPLRDSREVVAKLPNKEIPHNTVLQQVSDGQVNDKKHAGGRPRKDGLVHRSTTWRRQQKEIQGVLI